VRAVFVTAFAEVPEVVELADPACDDDAVIVRVEATGLCRSDWHGWMGHDPDITLPHVPGHELSGTIVQVGRSVTGWSRDDRVTVPFVLACGACESCRSGHGSTCPNQLQPGFSNWGSFATLVAIPRAAFNLVRIPDGMAFATAASLGCRYATAYRAVLGIGGLLEGEWLVVFGAGGVGLSAVQIAVAQGARVVAVDVAERARAASLALGAETALSFDDGVAEAVRGLTGGGAHISVDALGSAETLAASLSALRTGGRHVQVGLLPAAAGRPEVPMDRVIAKELAILGSHGMAAADYPAMLARIDAGELQPDRLIGRTISLDDAPEALASMDRPQPVAGMTVILP
jgi:D-arabinose 1-dehydrogenase-like Zn-dependent alcohol dehydrogenase